MKVGSRNYHERAWCQQGLGEYLQRVWPRQKDLHRVAGGSAVAKNSTTSLFLFMEACGLEEEEELSTLATVT